MIADILYAILPPCFVTRWLDRAVLPVLPYERWTLAHTFRYGTDPARLETDAERYRARLLKIKG